MPDTALQRALLVVGNRKNGKSLFLSLGIALVGKDNASTRTPQEFAETRFAAADLYGRLVNISADIARTAIRQVDMFKRLRDTIPLRCAYEPPNLRPSLWIIEPATYGNLQAPCAVSLLAPLPILVTALR